MISHIIKYQAEQWQNVIELSNNSNKCRPIALIFADRKLLEKEDFILATNQQFNDAEIIFCSTAGEINHLEITVGSAVCAWFRFDSTPFQIVTANIADYKNSFELGASVSKKLKQDDLRYVMIIADGNKINGDEILSGIQNILPQHVIISGGMAGDGVNFKKTIVGQPGNLRDGNVILLGLYGKYLKVGNGFSGGWDMYGPERQITKSSSNVLFEIDGENALDLYKKYLGKYADGLPSSALFFPISIKTNEDDLFIVRTILSVDEQNKSMTFAGNMTEGATIRFMKSNADRLIHAAAEAGYKSIQALNNENADLAIIVSCIGRRLVLDNRTEEEVEAAIDKLNASTAVAGFFSYGEIVPDSNKRRSHLHNQTFSVTTFTELPRSS